MFEEERATGLYAVKVIATIAISFVCGWLAHWLALQP